jgi:large subunit ribosomal protein L6
MSRIGKKPIPIPKGVTVKIEGNTVLVQGPKGKLDTALPAGIKVEQKDGNIVAMRENDSQAAVHGLARAWSTTRSKASPRAGRANWKSSASAIAPR